MKIIGLTGGSGVGKGVVCSLLKKFNFASIDTDAVYHSLTSTPDSPCLKALIKEFGTEIISSGGTLDRKALAKAVFKDGAEDKRAILNKISHAFVIDEVRGIISKLKCDGYCAVVVDAPLLFESGFEKECDIILCVIAKKDTRIKRITQRDGISEEMANARISAQLCDEFLMENSDFVIYNDGDITELENQIECIANKIINN